VALAILDAAMQVHGAAGVSSDTPLAQLYAEVTLQPGYLPLCDHELECGNLRWPLCCPTGHRLFRLCDAYWRIDLAGKLSSCRKPAAGETA